jgi:ATP-dependent DNA helicase DinG
MGNSEPFLETHNIFAQDGPVATSFSGFEYRPQQIEMADAVEAAILNGRHLAVEAGTGVGKSFAYLAPAVEAVRRRLGRMLISTFTITLQEQLINKDIPFLARCLPHQFSAVLAKGRNNYLCRRRLEFALRRQKGLFDETGSTLAAIKDWADRTEDGSLSDIPFLPKSSVWDAVNSDYGNCRARKCPHFRACFYWRARRQLETADIIVANHALMFSDLVLKEQGASVLPDYRYVIIDEAHNIEHVAEEHFGIDISNYRVKFLLDGLYNPRTHKGLLAYTNAHKAIDIVIQTAKEAKTFFSEVKNWYEETKGHTGGRCEKGFVDDTISGHLKNLRLELNRMVKEAGDDDEKLEVARFADRCDALLQDLNNFLTQSKGDCVYWVEADGDEKSGVRLKSAPINVGPDVKRCLFDKYKSVILTSATLSCGSRADKSGFSFFAGRIGLDDFDAIKLGSPFDYERQARIYIEKDLPEPNNDKFAGAAAEVLKKYILQTQGRAFVLFTSYTMLEAIADKIAGWLDENDIKLLQQGAGIDRTTLLKHFRSGDRNVLFGTDSFWQGVDVPGEALSNVIIVRLPFAVPDKPLLAGRLQQIRENGGNPFYEYQLPSAIIKFKQGFGRLIRSKTDTGIVVILDSRIITKPYGAEFLSAIPKCRVEIVSAED